MRTFIIDIEKIAFGGAGFGRLDGKACFVPFTAPGDKVRIRPLREKSSYIEAELLELIDPSPSRVAPLCPVFGQCGGCSFQHLPYETQIVIKEELFAEQLYRFARVDRSAIKSIVAAENHWHYRTRVQVKARWVGGALKLGFYRQGSHFVIPFPSSCLIASSIINAFLPGLQKLLSLSPDPERIPQIDIATGDDGQSIFIFHYIGQSPADIAEYLRLSHSLLPGVTGIWMQQGRKDTLTSVHGNELLHYSLLTGLGPSERLIRLAFSKGGFSQVNFEQNRKMISLVSEMAGLSGVERILDLYCGNGNISLPLAVNSKEVIGIEEYLPSIEDARKNAEANSIDNVKFYCADAVTEVERMAEAENHFDLILLDPPRTGAAQLAKHIPMLNANKIIYVSCDPVTLARDIAILMKFDYRVVSSVPVDMFPHTYHIESVTLLQRY